MILFGHTCQSFIIVDLNEYVYSILSVIIVLRRNRKSAISELFKYKYTKHRLYSVYRFILICRLHDILNCHGPVIFRITFSGLIEICSFSYSALFADSGTK